MVREAQLGGPRQCVRALCRALLGIQLPTFWPCQEPCTSRDATTFSRCCAVQGAAQRSFLKAVGLNHCSRAAALGPCLAAWAWAWWTRPGVKAAWPKERAPSPNPRATRGRARRFAAVWSWLHRHRPKPRASEAPPYGRNPSLQQSSAAAARNPIGTRVYENVNYENLLRSSAR